MDLADRFEKEGDLIVEYDLLDTNPDPVTIKNRFLVLERQYQELTGGVEGGARTPLQIARHEAIKKFAQMLYNKGWHRILNELVLAEDTGRSGTWTLLLDHCQDADTIMRLLRENEKLVQKGGSIYVSIMVTDVVTKREIPSTCLTAEHLLEILRMQSCCEWSYPLVFDALIRLGAADQADEDSAEGTAAHLDESCPSDGLFDRDRVASYIREHWPQFMN